MPIAQREARVIGGMTVVGVEGGVATTGVGATTGVAGVGVGSGMSDGDGLAGRRAVHVVFVN